MKLKRRLFSGASEASPAGISYHTAQITSEYVLDPVENVIYKIEKSPVGDIDTVKKNTGRVKGIVKPFNDYFKYLKDKRERRISKKRSKRIKSFSTALEEKLYGRPFLGRRPLIRGGYSHRSIPGVTGMTPELPSHRKSSILPPNLPPIVKKETSSLPTPKPTVPPTPKPTQQPKPQNKPKNNSSVGSGFFKKVKKGGSAVGRGICETGKAIGIGAAALGTGISLSLLHSKNDEDDE